MEWVVAGEDGLWCYVLCSLEWGCCLDGLDVPAVATVEGLDNHGSASLLALQAVASNVWCGDKGFVE